MRLVALFAVSVWLVACETPREPVAAAASRSELVGTPRRFASVVDPTPSFGAADPRLFYPLTPTVTTFLALSGLGDQELWLTDGTANGTRLVRDINPGPNGGASYGRATLNGQLYLTATDGVLGLE